jgi:hypothetical protein
MSVFGKIGKSLTKGWNDLTGVTQKNTAANQQAAMNQRALNEYATFTDPRYDQMQRNIVDQQLTGRAPDLNAADYARTTASPLQQLYQYQMQPKLQASVGGGLNPFGAGAAQVQNQNNQLANENTNREAYLRGQNMAEASQGGALTALQKAATGRANIYNGQANQVQASPSILSQISGVANTAKGIAGAFS